jgi:hypothetical protein
LALLLLVPLAVLLLAVSHTELTLQARKTAVRMRTVVLLLLQEVLLCLLLLISQQHIQLFQRWPMRRLLLLIVSSRQQLLHTMSDCRPLKLRLACAGAVVWTWRFDLVQ